MTQFQELKSWVGFDEADEQRLRAFWPLLEPHVEAVVARFYERVLASPGARAVLENDAQVERLRCSLQQWLAELVNGPWDDAYWARRERIGRRHVEVGLHSKYMMAGNAVLLEAIGEVARRVRPDEAPQITVSVQRVLHLDLAIMTGTYVESREQRQLGALQDLLVAHLRTIVMLVADDGRITAATRPTCELFGGCEVLGRDWTEAVPGALLEAAELVERVDRARQTGREISLPRVDADDDGRTRSFRIHVVPLQHPLASVLVQIEELTDAVALEARLRRSESLAQIGSLSAAVAHELRNPLAGISGALQVIGRSLPEDAPYRPIMVKVQQEIHRLNGLVTDLLAFAKPAAGCLGELELSAEVDRAIELVRADWPDVRFERNGDGPAAADPNLLQQVLLNLLQNAAQAVDGRGAVRIEVRPGAVLVADDGPGVPLEQRHDVFRPFYTTKTRGTGLGLSISERSAHAMHGRLRLLPEGPLPGATFLLELRQGRARDSQ